MAHAVDGCEQCKRDWSKCGTCHVSMQWVKEQRERNKKQEEEG